MYRRRSFYDLGAAEFVGRFKKERRSFPALALNTNTSTVTAVGNDYGYDVVFSRQIDGFARKGDVVIGISTSGNSKNVQLALELAKERGCYTAAFLGKDGGTIKNVADLPIVVKCNNTPQPEGTCLRDVNLPALRDGKGRQAGDPGGLRYLRDLRHP